MRRRELLCVIGLSAVVWPLTAHGQQATRRIGVLMSPSTADLEGQKQAAALRRGLEDLGWLSGRIEIEFRWYGGDVEKARALTRELAELRPDLLVAAGTPSLFVLQQATRTPILFINVADPLVQGFVESLARPGGNITGFGLEEPTIGAKWVQLLTEIAPSFHQCHVQPGDSPLCAHVSAVNGSVASVHRVTNISRQQ